jgi:hypothetical protein
MEYMLLFKKCSIMTAVTYRSHYTIFVPISQSQGGKNGEKKYKQKKIESN